MQSIKSNNWDNVKKILRAKPKVDVASFIPQHEKLSVFQAQKLHELQLKALMAYKSDLVEKQTKERAEKERDNHAIERLNRRRQELEQELKSISAELLQITLNGQAGILKVIEKDINYTSECIVQVKQSIDKVGKDISDLSKMIQTKMTEWTCDMVLLFVESIGVDKHEEKMANHKIDGAIFAHLSSAELRQMGFNYRDLMSILKAIFIVIHFETFEAPPGPLCWSENDVKSWLTDNAFAHLIPNFEKLHVRTNNPAIAICTND